MAAHGVWVVLASPLSSPQRGRPLVSDHPKPMKDLVSPAEESCDTTTVDHEDYPKKKQPQDLHVGLNFDSLTKHPNKSQQVLADVLRIQNE